MEPTPNQPTTLTPPNSQASSNSQLTEKHKPNTLLFFLIFISIVSICTASYAYLDYQHKRQTVSQTQQPVPTPSIILQSISPSESLKSEIIWQKTPKLVNRESVIAGLLNYSNLYQQDESEIRKISKTYYVADIASGNYAGFKNYIEEVPVKEKVEIDGPFRIDQIFLSYVTDGNRIVITNDLDLYNGNFKTIPANYDSSLIMDEVIRGYPWNGFERSGMISDPSNASWQMIRTTPEGYQVVSTQPSGVTQMPFSALTNPQFGYVRPSGIIYMNDSIGDFNYDDLDDIYADYRTLFVCGKVEPIFDPGHPIDITKDLMPISNNSKISIFRLSPELENEFAIHIKKNPKFYDVIKAADLKSGGQIPYVIIIKWSGFYRALYNQKIVSALVECG